MKFLARCLSLKARLRNPRVWWCLLAPLALMGCDDRRARVYEIPKEREAEAVPAGHGAGGGMPHVHYQLPPGWKELPADGLRVARFGIPGESGHDADVAVIPLVGVTAPKLDIVNLWRQQIQLPPLQDPKALSDLSTKVQIGSHDGELFDMASTEPLIDGKPARLVVAMLELPAMTWFFKMMGQDKLVEEQKPAFVDFLKSVSFEFGTMPAPQVASAPPSGASDTPQWKVPADWKAEGSSAMTLAKFSAQDKGGGQATVTVTVLGGEAGGVLPNVNRWRGQLGLSPTDEGGLAKMTTSLDLAGPDAILVDMTGVDVKSGQKDSARMLAAIVPHAGRTWFYKMTGDPAVVERQKDAFVQFVQSVKYPNAP